MQDIVLFVQHHWLLSLALVVVLFLTMVMEFVNQKRSAIQLSPAKTTQLINHENAAIIDIRPADQFTDGHIIGSLSVPPGQLEQQWKKLEKLKAQPIVIVCASGTESPRTANLFTQKGFNIHLLAGGIRAWREAGMPLVKE